MNLTFDQIGWTLAWDKEGKYPLDTTKPLEIVDKDEITIYMVTRPVQEEDGKWYKYISLLDKKLYRASSHHSNYRFHTFGYYPFFIKTGEKKQEPFSESKGARLKNLSLEEFSIYNNVDLKEKYLEWVENKNTLCGKSDSVLETCSEYNNLFYINGETVKDVLGVKIGESFISYNYVPYNEEGINLNRVYIKNDNELNFTNVPYKQNISLLLRAKIKSSDFPDGQDEMTIFDHNSLIQLNVLKQSGQLKVTIYEVVNQEKRVFYISGIKIDDTNDIYVQVSQENKKIEVGINGNIKEFNNLNLWLRYEEYVEQNGSIGIKFTKEKRIGKAALRDDVARILDDNEVKNNRWINSKYLNKVGKTAHGYRNLPAASYSGGGYPREGRIPFHSLIDYEEIKLTNIRGKKFYIGSGFTIYHGYYNRILKIEIKFQNNSTSSRNIVPESKTEDSSISDYWGGYRNYYYRFKKEDVFSSYERLKSCTAYLI